MPVGEPNTDSRSYYEDWVLGCVGVADEIGDASLGIGWKRASESESPRS